MNRSLGHDPEQTEASSLHALACPALTALALMHQAARPHARNPGRTPHRRDRVLIHSTGNHGVFVQAAHRCNPPVHRRRSRARARSESDNSAAGIRLRLLLPIYEPFSSQDTESRSPRTTESPLAGAGCPSRTTFWPRRTTPRCPRARMRFRSAEGCRSRLNSSRSLWAGNLAALIGVAVPAASRTETSRERKVARYSSWDPPASRAGSPGRRNPSLIRGARSRCPSLTDSGLRGNQRPHSTWNPGSWTRRSAGGI